MAMIFRRLSVFPLIHPLQGFLLKISNVGRRPLNRPNYRNLSFCSADPTGCTTVGSLSNAGLKDSGVIGEEFSKWRNGGGRVHKSVSIDQMAFVEIGAVVHEKAILGADVHVGSGTVVGSSVTIGRSTKIGFNVNLHNCTVGDCCVIHNGVSIGQDGFGFYVDEHGNVLKKPQMLNVRIGNHVEIGANSCVDRGSWRDTVIGDHSKIDNLVQIGHNVIIGKCCLLCGQVGIAGSATLGDYVTLGGRVAVRDHVSIVSKVRLAATSCVTKDISEPGDYGGFPAVPVHQWRRQIVQSQISNRRKT